MATVHGWFRFGLMKLPCGAPARREITLMGLHSARGPLLPFAKLAIAALQLHQTGHSSIAKHFE